MNRCSFDRVGRVRNSSMILVFVCATLCSLPSWAATAFTYQGALRDDLGDPASGSHDFEFTLYDAASNGNPLGSTVALGAVTVNDGLFTVEIDFGNAAFDGSDVWMEIRTAFTGQPLMTLSPRQLIRPAPLALNAGFLDGMDSSAFLTGEVDGDPTNELQNVFATINADSGATTADSVSDALTIVGSGAISTSISGDTLTISGASIGDSLGNHTAIMNLDLGANSLVGSGGTVGVTVANDGDVTFGSLLTVDGVSNTITSSSGTIHFDDDDLATTGTVTSSVLIASGLDCSANLNGGMLIADASGVVSCTDDDTASNTLDEAYDQGGGGSGRTITTDAGAVRIEGAGGLELIGGSLEQFPGTPTIIGTLPIGDSPQDLYVSGRYVYITDTGSDDLKVVDVSDPTSPELVGSLAVPGRGESIYVSGRYAYISEQIADELLIVDVSNPSAPVLVGNLDLSGLTFFTLLVSGHYAYIVESTNSDILVFDVADPTEPALIAQVAGGNGDARYADLVGRYLYVVDSSSDDLKVYDVVNPSAPVLAGSVALGPYPNKVIASGRYAYVFDEDDRDLKVIDVSDPSDLAIVGTLALERRPQTAFVAGKYLYVVDIVSDDLKIIDVSDPTTPFVAASTAGTLLSPEAVRVSGKYAYVADQTNDALYVYDLSGVETTSVTAHAAETGDLQVRSEVTTHGHIQVGGGLNVGGGGLFSDGDVGVSGTVTLASDAAPASSPANLVQLYAEDVASSSELRVRDEAGNVTTLSPHNFSLLGQPSEPMAWSYFSENAYGTINVDVLRAIRLIERYSGESLVRIEWNSSMTSEEPTVRTAALSDIVAEISQQNALVRLRNAQLIDRIERLEALLQISANAATDIGGEQ